MQSDCLILFPTPLEADAMAQAKAALFDVAESVLVHQKEGQARCLLVKYDPRDISPGQLLDAVRGAGFEASMAGG